MDGEEGQGPTNPELTLFSSFWYCGIFFRMWDRSLMLAYGGGWVPGEARTQGRGSQLQLKMQVEAPPPGRSFPHQAPCGHRRAPTLSVVILLLSQKVFRSSVTFLARWEDRLSGGGCWVRGVGQSNRGVWLVAGLTLQRTGLMGVA